MEDPPEYEDIQTPIRLVDIPQLFTKKERTLLIIGMCAIIILILVTSIMIGLQIRNNKCKQ